MVHYIRPEILGLVLGAFAAALVSREFRTPRRFQRTYPVCSRLRCHDRDAGFPGLSPACYSLRLAGGDLNALVGIAGLVEWPWNSLFAEGFSWQSLASQNRQTVMFLSES